MKKPQNKKIVLAGVVWDYFYWYNGRTMLIWLGYGAPKNYIYMYIYIYSYPRITGTALTNLKCLLCLSLQSLDCGPGLPASLTAVVFARLQREKTWAGPFHFTGSDWWISFPMDSQESPKKNWIAALSPTLNQGCLKNNQKNSGQFSG